MQIDLEKYLLRVRAQFVADSGAINWTTHVFLARYLSGDINPLDTHEIREARFISHYELPIFDDILRKINTGGFRYRSFITRSALELMGIAINGPEDKIKK